MLSRAGRFGRSIQKPIASSATTAAITPTVILMVEGRSRHAHAITTRTKVTMTPLPIDPVRVFACRRALRVLRLMLLAFLRLGSGIGSFGLSGRSARSSEFHQAGGSAWSCRWGGPDPLVLSSGIADLSFVACSPELGVCPCSRRTSVFSIILLNSALAHADLVTARYGVGARSRGEGGLPFCAGCLGGGA